MHMFFVSPEVSFSKSDEKLTLRVPVNVKPLVLSWWNGDYNSDNEQVQ